MSRHVSRLLFYGVAVLFTSAAPAADKLPKDGAWARYYVVVSFPNGKEYLSRYSIRFVGTVVENGKRHRWIEFFSDHTIRGGGKSVRKFLLPEKALRESSHPLRQYVRGWKGEPGKTPMPLPTSGPEKERAAIGGTSLLFLPAVLKPSKVTRNPRTVDYQKGRLRMKSGRAGTFRDMIQEADGRVITWKSDYEVWSHKNVPLWMVSRKSKEFVIYKNPNEKETVGSRRTLELTLEDWGTDAKSALPNAK